MGKFFDLLDAKEIGTHDGRAVWRLNAAMVYEIDPSKMICVPIGFETDFASVPRVPLAFWLWGDRAHREAVIHDFLYRKDAYIYDLAENFRTRRYGIPKEDADWYFREAMMSENPDVQKKAQPYHIYQPMYLAVRACGGSSYHRMNVEDRFELDEVGP